MQALRAIQAIFANVPVVCMFLGAGLTFCGGVVPVKALADDGPLVQVAARATRISRRFRDLLDEARRDGDALRARCYDRSLTEVHSVLRRAEHAGGVRAPSSLARVLEAELSRLARTSCLGDRAVAAGTTVVEVTVRRAGSRVLVARHRSRAYRRRQTVYQGAD